MEGAYCSVINCCEFLPCLTHQEEKQDVESSDFLTLMTKVASLIREICREFHSNSLETVKKKRIDEYSAEGQALLPPLLQQVFKQIGDLALFKADKFTPFDDQVGNAQGLKNKTLDGLIQAAKIAQNPLEDVLRKVRRAANLLPDDIVLGPIKKVERMKEKIEELEKENKHCCAIFDVNRAIIVCETHDDFVCTRTALYSLFGAVVQLKNKMSLVKGKLCSNAPCLLFQLGIKRESCSALSELLEEGKEWIVEIQVMNWNLFWLYQHSHVFYAITRGEALPSECVKCHNLKGAIADNKKHVVPLSVAHSDHRWDIALMRASPLISAGTFESGYELANFLQALTKRNRQVRVKSAIATLEELRDVAHQGAVILHLVCPFDPLTKRPIFENELGLGVPSKVPNPIHVHMQRRPPKLVFLIGCWSEDLAAELAKDIPYVCRISQFESLERCSKFSSCVCKLLCDGETVDMAFECAMQEYDTQQFVLLGSGDRKLSIISPPFGILRVDDGNRVQENISCLVSSAVGRNRDLSCLVQLLAQIRASNYSKAAVLTGPRLIGKSHLVKALSRFIIERSKQIHQYDGIFYVDKKKKSSLQPTLEAKVAFVMFGAKVDNLVDAISQSGKFFLLVLDEVDEEDNELIRSILSTCHVSLLVVVPRLCHVKELPFVTHSVELLEDNSAVQKFWSDSWKHRGTDPDEKTHSESINWQAVSFGKGHPGKLVWLKELLEKAPLDQLLKVDLEAHFVLNQTRSSSLTNTLSSILNKHTQTSSPRCPDIGLTAQYALDIFAYLATLERDNKSLRLDPAMVVHTPCTSICGCSNPIYSHVMVSSQKIELRSSTSEDVYAAGLVVCGYLFDISLPNPRQQLKTLKGSDAADIEFLHFLDRILQREFCNFETVLDVFDRRVHQIKCHSVLNGPTTDQINISGARKLLNNVVQNISPGAYTRFYLTKPGSLVLRFVVTVATPMEWAYVCDCLDEMMANPQSALRRSQLLGPFLNEFSYTRPKAVSGLQPRQEVERPFSRAARNGILAEMQLLLSLNPLLIDQRDSYGRTALLHTISNNHLESARWLLRNFPTSIYDVDFQNHSVFDYVSSNPMLKLLLHYDCTASARQMSQMCESEAKTEDKIDGGGEIPENITVLDMDKNSDSNAGFLENKADAGEPLAVDSEISESHASKENRASQNQSQPSLNSVDNPVSIYLVPVGNQDIAAKLQHFRSTWNANLTEKLKNLNNVGRLLLDMDPDLHEERVLTSLQDLFNAANQLKNPITEDEKALTKMLDISQWKEKLQACLFMSRFNQRMRDIGDLVEHFEQGVAAVEKVIECKELTSIFTLVQDIMQRKPTVQLLGEIARDEQYKSTFDAIYKKLTPCEREQLITMLKPCDNCTKTYNFDSMLTAIRQELLSQQLIIDADDCVQFTRVWAQWRDSTLQNVLSMNNDIYARVQEVEDAFASPYGPSSEPLGSVLCDFSDFGKKLQQMRCAEPIERKEDDFPAAELKLRSVLLSAVRDNWLIGNSSFLNPHLHPDLHQRFNGLQSCMAFLKTLYDIDHPRWVRIRDRVRVGMVKSTSDYGNTSVSMGLAKEYFTRNPSCPFVGFLNGGTGGMKLQLYARKNNVIYAIAETKKYSGIKLLKVSNIETKHYKPTCKQQDKISIDEAKKILNHQMKEVDWTSKTIGELCQEHKLPFTSNPNTKLPLFMFVTGIVRNDWEREPDRHHANQIHAALVCLLQAAGAQSWCACKGMSGKNILIPQDQEAFLEMQGCITLYGQLDALFEEERSHCVACLGIGSGSSQWVVDTAASGSSKPPTFDSIILEHGMLANKLPHLLCDKVLDTYDKQPARFNNFLTAMEKAADDGIPLIALKSGCLLALVDVNCCNEKHLPQSNEYISQICNYFNPLPPIRVFYQYHHNNITRKVSSSLILEQSWLYRPGHSIVGLQSRICADAAKALGLRKQFFLIECIGKNGIDRILEEDCTIIVSTTNAAFMESTHVEIPHWLVYSEARNDQKHGAQDDSRERVQKVLQGELLSPWSRGCFASPIRDDIFHWIGIITGPDDSDFHQGVFELDITINDRYPKTCPSLKFINVIPLHPNVDNKTGEVALVWREHDSMSINTVLCKVRNLLCIPNREFTKNKKALDLLSQSPEKYAMRAYQDSCQWWIRSLPNQARNAHTLFVQPFLVDRNVRNKTQLQQAKTQFDSTHISSPKSTDDLESLKEQARLANEKMIEEKVEIQLGEATYSIDIIVSKEYLEEMRALEERVGVYFLDKDTTNACKLYNSMVVRATLEHLRVIKIMKIIMNNYALQDDYQELIKIKSQEGESKQPNEENVAYFTAKAKYLEPAFRDVLKWHVNIINDTKCESAYLLRTKYFARIQFAPPKSKARALTKPQNVTDYLRITVVLVNPYFMVLFYGRLKKHFEGKIIAVKNKHREEELFPPPCLHIEVMFKEHVAEIQLILEDFMLVKDYSHNIYDVMRLRDISEIDAAAHIASQGIYLPHPGVVSRAQKYPEDS